MTRHCMFFFCLLSIVPSPIHQRYQIDTLSNAAARRGSFSRTNRISPECAERSSLRLCIYIFNNDIYIDISDRVNHHRWWWGRGVYIFIFFWKRGFCQAREMRAISFEYIIIQRARQKNVPVWFPAASFPLFLFFYIYFFKTTWTDSVRVLQREHGVIYFSAQNIICSAEWFTESRPHALTLLLL